MHYLIGAVYDTPHEVDNGILLPYVMEYNAPATVEKYKEIARNLGVEEILEIYKKAFK